MLLLALTALALVTVALIAAGWVIAAAVQYAQALEDDANEPANAPRGCDCSLRLDHCDSRCCPTQPWSEPVAHRALSTPVHASGVDDA